MTPPDAIAPFLAAIVATPECDLPRLVLADALDAGDYPGLPADAARSEFIRTQVELAELGIGCTLNTPHHWTKGPDGTEYSPCLRCARRDALRRRERDLLQPWNFWDWIDTTRFFPGSPGVCISADGECSVNRWAFRFRRGFVESVTLPAADLLTYLDALLTAAPVTRITLAEGPSIERPAGCGVAAFRAAAGAVARATPYELEFRPDVNCIVFRDNSVWSVRPNRGPTLCRRWDLVTPAMNAPADIPAECRAWPRVTLGWTWPRADGFYYAPRGEWLRVGDRVSVRSPSGTPSWYGGRVRQIVPASPDGREQIVIDVAGGTVNTSAEYVFRE